MDLSVENEIIVYYEQSYQIQWSLIQHCPHLVPWWSVHRNSLLY